MRKISYLGLFCGGIYVATTLYIFSPMVACSFALGCLNDAFFAITDPWLSFVFLFVPNPIVILATIIVAPIVNTILIYIVAAVLEKKFFHREVWGGDQIGLAVLAIIPFLLTLFLLQHSLSAVLTPPALPSATSRHGLQPIGEGDLKTIPR